MADNHVFTAFDDKVEDREKIIVRTSIIGIVANVFLAGFKAVIGVITNSIAVTLDAVNNLSDALSSVITIIGADRKSTRLNSSHPTTSRMPSSA